MSLDEIFTAVLLQKHDNISRLWPFICPFPCRFGICPNPCQRENVFTLHYSDEKFENHGQLLLSIEEKSKYIERCCCVSFLRPIVFQGKDQYGNIVVTADKGLYLFEPEIKVHFKGNLIGTLMEPCILSIVNCKYSEIRILDSNDTPIMKIIGSIFQFGTCCLCGNIRFSILNVNDEEIGFITHLFNSCKREFCSKEDQFAIKFPEFSTLDEKILIVFGAILLNYLYFEAL